MKPPMIPGPNNSSVSFYYNYVQPVLSSLMAVVIIWLGSTTLDSSKKVSNMELQMKYMQRSVDALNQRANNAITAEMLMLRDQKIEMLEERIKKLENELE